MIVGFIDRKLKERLRKKQQEVVRLRWQKAEIEKRLDGIKKQECLDKS